MGGVDPAQVRAHIDACSSLGELLFNVESVRCGMNGKHEAVLLVYVKDRPAQIPFREFQGLPVLWKILGEHHAL